MVQLCLFCKLEFGMNKLGGSFPLVAKTLFFATTKQQQHSKIIKLIITQFSDTVHKSCEKILILISHFNYKSHY
jgi:hypothetical protein